MLDRCLSCANYELCFISRKRCRGYEPLDISARHEDEEDYDTVESGRTEYYNDWYRYVSQFDDDIFF